MLQCNMQHNPTQTTFHPLLPTPLALTLTSFPAVHLSQYVASLSHRYLGNYLISLDDDGPSVEVDIPLQMPLKPKDNLTYKQIQALKKLIIDDTIIINTLDQHTIHHNIVRSQLHLNRHHNPNKMTKPTKSKDKGEPQQNTTHTRSHLHKHHPQKINSTPATSETPTIPTAPNPLQIRN